MLSITLYLNKTKIYLIYRFISTIFNKNYNIGNIIFVYRIIVVVMILSDKNIFTEDYRVIGRGPDKEWGEELGIL